ncbi:hypothetical protein GP486_004940 [Trichoglossum hirsutum]|uniref:Protein kinase domain-containing protein n=1 Tax=Trichoglossum hirsutum TaxID=265104 RepID=A0A9P8LAC2_9PEZI|nr:hypothetical protein GP486_004940 [Trichoglossum hirsutum]
MGIFKCLIEPILALRNSLKKEQDHRERELDHEKQELDHKERDELSRRLSDAQIPTPPATGNGEPPSPEPTKPPAVSKQPLPTLTIGNSSGNALTVPSPKTPAQDSDTSSHKSNDGNSLKDRLRRARREWPERSHRFFVPRCAQKSLISQSDVKSIIQAGHPAIEEKDANDYAERTCQSARQLFAILAYMEKGPEICSLLREEVSDNDLPLHRTDSQGPFTLQRKTGARIETLAKWNDSDLEEFDRIQWWMIAPFFEDKSHYRLEQSATLPFIPFESSDEPKVGGYSEVYFRRLHPAHHNFWERSEFENDEPLVAIKRLYSPDETDFQKEATILKALSPKGHPHLINLLATFQHKQKYHLIFPYADSNLRKYWEDRPHPSFDKQTVMWSVRQMAGIANALLMIHNFRVTFPLSPSGGGVRLHGDAKLSVGPGEELFGRHGDIKPENILWFKKIQEIDDDMGVLQVADFGLGRFHGRDSRSGISPSGVVSSPTYEPPECKLHKPVSRSYDIWSLGCIILEFVTWLLKGSAEINGFADFRGKLSSIGINEDYFFTITDDKEAVVRDAVIEWVAQLHEHERCSKVIHDLLDLTMRELLVVDSKERATARDLSHELGECLRKAQSDERYLLTPVPSPKRAPLAPDSPRTHSKKNVTFSSPGKTVAQANGSNSPRDLVLRNAGTPGFMSRHSGTWPPDAPRSV